MALNMDMTMYMNMKIYYRSYYQTAESNIFEISDCQIIYNITNK
jgi:hypothetical protein